MAKKEKLITRRHFLKGAQGLTLAIPFLPSLAPRELWAQEGDAPPLRFIAMIDRYGQYAKNWYPTIQAPNVVANEFDTRYMKLSDIQGPISRALDARFDKYRNKLSLLLGLDVLSYDASHWGGSSGPLCAASKNESDAVVYPYSIDYIMESTSIGKNVQIPAIRTAPERGRLHYSWNKTQIPGEKDASILFDKVFTNKSAPTDQGAVKSSLAVDRVLEHYNQLKSSRKISSLDKQRLNQHMAHLYDVQSRLQLQARACTGPNLRDAGDAVPDYYKNFFEIIAVAMACGLTRIGTVALDHFQPQRRQNRSQWHGGTHAHFESQEAADAKLPEVQLQFGWVKTFLDTLESTIDVNGGSLFDSTIFLMTNEMAIPAHHSKGMPVFVGGGGQGRLKMGYLVDYRQFDANGKVKRPMRSDFGYGGRPYNELLITILKAMGVKESEYQKNGNKGLGDYSPHRYMYGKIDFYQRYFAQKDRPLPFFANFSS